MKPIDVLAKIDEFLEDKKNSEVTMLKICVFAVTAFLIYTFAYPAANKFYESEKARNIYLNQNLDRSLQDEKILADSSDTNLNDLKEKLAETKKINGYFGIKFNELKTQTAENGNIIVFLNDLTKLAQKNNVKIVKILNKIDDTIESGLNKFLEINLEFKANFADTIRYLNDIEISSFTPNVEKISLIPLENDLQGELKILLRKVGNS